VRRSLVVPCFQEAEALDAGLVAILSMPFDQVVLVDDGSTDGTAERLAAAARRDPRVRVETHAENRGVGAAVRTGVASADGDVIVVYDADRTYPEADALRLVDAVRAGADVASASPFAPGGQAAGVAGGRRFLSRAAAFAYRVAIGRRARGVTAFTCAFRAYRAEALRAVRWRSDGFPAAAETLGRLLLAGARAVEVPSRLSTRTEGRSKMRVARAAAGHAGTLVRLIGLRAARAFRRPASPVTPA
jgi:dolichol-phosphate mannosyltransferase